MTDMPADGRPCLYHTLYNSLVTYFYRARRCSFPTDLQSAILKERQAIWD